MEKKWVSRRMRSGDAAVLPDGTRIRIRRRKGSLELWFQVAKDTHIKFDKRTERK